MREIADAAGVSVATVSRALKGDPVVNEETRARVAETAARLAYRVNPVARSLRTQRTQMILAVVPDIGNPFYSYVLAGIEDEAQRNGYAVLIGNLSGDASRLRAYGDQVLSGRADGIILLTGRPPGDVWLDDFVKIAPVVALCEPIAGVPFVGIDDRAAAAEAVGHLISLGCRRIAHIRGPRHSAAADAREAGYRDALAAAGLPVDAKLIGTGDTTIDSGHRVTTTLVVAQPDIDAIFAANEEMAIGAVNALRALGRPVPGAVRVSGCDGLEFGAKYFPPLTTIEQPRPDLGSTAVATLLKVMHNEDVPSMKLLPHKLVARATTVDQVDHTHERTTQDFDQ
jgi:LacI family repressor for deo operon, udp, cdd, tsx, nupC, and nupG